MVFNMFVDGVDSNANIVLSAALRQQLQITLVFGGLMTVALRTESTITLIT